MFFWFCSCIVLWFHGFMVLWFYSFLALSLYCLVLLRFCGFVVLWFCGFVVSMFYPNFTSCFQEDVDIISKIFRFCYADLHHCSVPVFSKLVKIFEFQNFDSCKIICFKNVPGFPPLIFVRCPGVWKDKSEVGGCTTGKSFRFVRACVRAVRLPSGIWAQCVWASLFPFPFLPRGAFSFPFWGDELSLPPTPPNLLCNFSWAYR